MQEIMYCEEMCVREHFPRISFLCQWKIEVNGMSRVQDLLSLTVPIYQRSRQDSQSKLDAIDHRR